MSFSRWDKVPGGGTIVEPRNLMRVFISSTPDELELYQAVACDVAHGLGMEPMVRDPTAGRGRQQVAACARQVARADLVLVIVGWRRGRVPAPELGGDGLHPWTFWEVRSAFEHRKPVRVMMAGETWRPELGEEESRRGWAVMRDLRAELERLAVRFEDEGASNVGTAETLESFKEILRQQLRAAQQGLPAPAVEVDEVPRGGKRFASRERARLRAWPPPELPSRPFPLLLPYEHPDLFAGREGELAELRQLLRRGVSILGVHAASGVGKSSLLVAGLVPALRAESHPVAFDRHPHKLGLAQRLLGDLLDDLHDDQEVEEALEARKGNVGIAQHFMERLLDVVVLAGEVPLLILDQFEELFRGEGLRASRAMVGTLLAASVQRQPGLQGLPCHWLLAYRREFHGQVFSWLGDVLREARDDEFSAAAHLPCDLAGLDRFHDWPLPVLGGRDENLPPDLEELGHRDQGRDTATHVFQAAIEKPLAVCSDGAPHYPWRFAEGGAERLAQAFAEARIARPAAPLVPELQVVLGHLLGRSQAEEEDPQVHGSPVVVEVPEDPGLLIDSAVEEHLRRALETAFPVDGQAGVLARIGRTRALLALYELADVEGRRQVGLPADELAQAIGIGGHEVLERLATPETRLVILEKQEGDFRYALSHNRLAEVIVRAVEEEGRFLDLAVDAELLALRRFVALRSELYRSGEIGQATGVSRPQFRRITEHAEVLLWGGNRRQWWAACLRRRRQEQRRALLHRGIAVMAVVLVGLGVWIGVDRREQRRALFEQIVEGDPPTAFAALDQLARKPAFDGEELLALWRRREQPFDVFESGLGGLGEASRGVALLRLGELAAPFLAEAPEDPIRIASLVWALDFFAPDDHRTWQLRDKVLQPLRKRRPPPPRPGPQDAQWTETIGGTFRMESEIRQGDGETNVDTSRPRHQVRVSGFRMLVHEVTNAQYRLLVPEHGAGAGGDLPAVRMTWHEAYTYAAWLGGRLPTAAEWEYAARFGCNFAYCRRDGSEATLDEVAWWLGTSVNPETQEPAAKPVMQLEANPLGIFDLHGNVWEHVANWSGPDSGEGRDNPSGPTHGVFNVRERRGGSAWDPEGLVASGRGASEAVLRSRFIGLRVVLPVS